jgi:hypothetical protein
VIWTPKQLGANFADNLLERGVIGRFDYAEVADAIATAVMEDRLGGAPQDEEDTLP